MTQAEFASALGAPGSQSQVSLWERGKVRPTQETLASIAELAGGTIAMFTKGELREGPGVVREGHSGYGEDGIRAIIVDPNLARRVLGTVDPHHRKTRLAIIHEFEGAFVEAGESIPQWLEDLRREVLENES